MADPIAALRRPLSELAGLRDDNIRALLALGAAGWTGYYFFHLTFFGSKLTEYMMGMIVGYSAAILKDIFGYYFGSSSGSKLKTMQQGEQQNGA